MSLWGNKDSVYSDGTVAISGKTVTGTGTTFNTAGLINEGDVITVGAGQTQGEAVIASVTSGTVLVIKDASHLDTGTISGATYTISQKPVYTLKDTEYASTEIFGVDATEVGLANTTPYAVAHAGWVGVQTYIDTHGNSELSLKFLLLEAPLLVMQTTMISSAIADNMG